MIKRIVEKELNKLSDFDKVTLASNINNCALDMCPVYSEVKEKVQSKIDVCELVLLTRICAYIMDWKIQVHSINQSRAMELDMESAEKMISIYKEELNEVFEILQKKGKSDAEKLDLISKIVSPF